MKLFVIFVVINYFVFHVSCTNAENVTSDVLQFDDLNYDVLFEIFDNLEFKDLFNLIEVNSKYRELISRHYALKYRIQEKKVYFNSVNYKKISSKDNLIMIYDTNLFAKFLRIFGQWISRIEIEDSYNSLVESAVIEYCSESLTELSIIEVRDKTILWQKPFEHVIKLHLNLQGFHYDRNRINLTEIFPSLRHLHIETRYILVDQLFHFPNLEQMEFPIHRHVQGSYDAIQPYVRFIELNPQLRNVHLNLMLHLSEEGSLKLLRVTNEKLPDLEVFELTLFARAHGTILHVNETVHFKNVKKLILHTHDDETDLLPIWFDQVEEIEVLGFIDVVTNQKCLDFVVKNRKIRTLSINYILNFGQWSLIADNLPLLNELRTYWKSRNKSSGLIALMNRESNLKEVTLNLKLSEESYTVLRDLLYPKWEIDGELKNNKTEVTFLRSY